MIGVVAERSSFDIIREFFELFKTPWEPHQGSREYDVLLCADGLECETEGAKLVLLYSSGKLASDSDGSICTQREGEGALLSRAKDELPIYGQFRSFCVETDAGELRDRNANRPVAWKRSEESQSVVRIGYDLFDEVRHLLTAGQPAQFAQIPTLELHIDFLRRLIVSAGIELIEIPPVPLGYQSITCLTHDIDHPSIRRHRWEHTCIGFLYRAIVSSVKDYLKGAIPFRDLCSNWTAACKLPLVYLGMARDFWSDFAERYRSIERGVPSTWFVVPVGRYAGRTGQGRAPAYRATRYGAADVASQIKDLLAAGCEVGLHGLDAWIDEASGRRELETIRHVTGNRDIGTRMHWLFFDQNSPALLDRAGATYDSTVGYRETIGFRAGTAQAYSPARTEKLLELPLHVMDTALFYPAYLGLRQAKATTMLKQLAEQMERFGGCLTINWHDRSLAPERQWYMPYRVLLDDLRKRNTWFATASEAVAWFRKRRAFKFHSTPDITSQSNAANGGVDGLPGLELRTYNRISTGTQATLTSIC